MKFFEVLRGLFTEIDTFLVNTITGFFNPRTEWLPYNNLKLTSQKKGGLFPPF